MFKAILIVVSVVFMYQLCLSPTGFNLIINQKHYLIKYKYDVPVKIQGYRQ